MKISLNWLKEFTSLELSVEALTDKIGAQLGAVDAITDLGKRYQDIVIVKVIECQPIDDTDHLNLCQLDDGGRVQNVERNTNGHVQVVCGASNVKAGLLVAWLPPGATVPASYESQPLKLSTRQIHGVNSNGMLASGRELAITDKHDGLLILDDGRPGDDFSQVYNLNDYIIDIENKMFTHRPDCFGQLGVARELAGITNQPFISPDWYHTPIAISASDNISLSVRNELPDLVPRFMVLAIANVTVQSSPVWLQSHLSRVGLRPINNLVDAANYMMLLTGQPLHIYDYDKLKTLSSSEQVTIVVRNPHAEEALKLINAKQIELRPESIVIATDKQVIGLGGVMGGADSEVDANTKNIVLECATFDMYSIRRTSMAHGLFSDAVTRYTKGQSPLQTDRVLAKTADLILDLSNGSSVASQVVDDNQLDAAVNERANLYPAVTITADYINQRLGLNLSATTVQSLLQNVEFSVDIDNDNLIIKPPFWRTDIELREDVVEEIGRLYGFDKLPLILPVRDIEPAKKNQTLEFKDYIRQCLSAAGANEVLTYSFVATKMLERAGQNPELAFRIGNALSPELQVYRLSLTPSLLDKIHLNVKAGYDDFVLFELGKGHNRQQLDESSLPVATELLEAVFAATSKQKIAGAAFYQIRSYLLAISQACSIELEFRPISEQDYDQIFQPYDLKRSAEVLIVGSEQSLGIIGEYKSSVTSNFKLPKYCAGFSIRLELLNQAAAKALPRYHVQPRFPKVAQDLTLRVAADLSYVELYNFLNTQLNQRKPETCWSSLKPIDFYQKTGDDQFKHVSFRIILANYQKTMTDTEVSEILSSIANAAQASYQTERL